MGEPRMAKQARARWASPQDWSEWQQYLAAGLDARNRWRLPVVLFGILFARGRRTVTSWLRAAGISTDYEDYYYFLSGIGIKASLLAERLLILILQVLALPERLLLVIDDTPTKRYGPKVEGADIHHNPTPGPADQSYLYGHIWVTISLAVRHPLWGALALPLRAMLYVRKRTLASIPAGRGWKFRTKLELASELLQWAARILKKAGKTVWVVVDGFYPKRPFLRAAQQVGTVVVGRLRKDAALYSQPIQPARRGRGRPRKYGKQRISLAKRAGQRRGWQQVQCLVYGQLKTKTVKTFVATWRPAGGLIRVVLIQEPEGWLALFCTDVNASVVEIVEAFSDRHTIEQCFHDVKEVWRAGQQQLRHIWRNVAAFNLNLWIHTLVELWAWNRSQEELCDRSNSPWDDAERRPSHANRRQALQRWILRNELSSITRVWLLPRKILRLVEQLMALAT